MKLGKMKQFVSVLPEEADTFKYMISKFPKVLEVKVKGAFIEPDIQQLWNSDGRCQEISINWTFLKEVVMKFLVNQKDPNFYNILENMMKNIQELGCSAHWTCSLTF